MSLPPGGLAGWLRRRRLPLIALAAAAATGAGLVAASRGSVLVRLRPRWSPRSHR